MDITPLVDADRQLIQSYGPAGFRVSGVLYDHPILVTPEKTGRWNISLPVKEFSMTDFQPLWEQETSPEIILLGCGDAGIFLPSALRGELKLKKLAVEAMDTGAACRTYNVLMTEGRLVAAALLPVTRR